MRRASAAVVLALLLSAAAPGADRDFKAVVGGIESQLGIRRMHIPLFGVAMFFAKTVARTQGVKQLDIAIFDEIDYRRPDAARFDGIVQSAVGDRWTPFVRVRSNRENESTYIYLRPDGKDWRMLVASFEAREAVVVHLKLNAEAVMRDFEDPAHARRHGHGDRGE
jgi:hypothetical protein